MECVKQMPIHYDEIAVSNILWTTFTIHTPETTFDIINSCKIIFSHSQQKEIESASLNALVLYHMYM